MPLNFRVPFSSTNIPFFILDIYNAQLITTPTIPSDIASGKEIVLTETPIPGLGFNPIQSGGMGNQKISFTLPLVKKNNSVGNVLMLKQFDNLRNPAFGLNINSLFSKNQFIPNPQVVFFWGSGQGVPLVYYVKKCDYVHKSSFTNAYGYTQYSEISMELWLDETNPLYLAEKLFRQAASVIMNLDQIFNLKNTNKIGGIMS